MKQYFFIPAVNDILENNQLAVESGFTMTLEYGGRENY